MSKKLVNYVSNLVRNPYLILRKFYTLIKISKKLLFFPINFILFISIILISKFKLIRVCKIKSDWVGEFVMRTEVYFQEKNYFKKNTIDILVLSEYISNEFFLEKIKSKSILFPSIFLDLFYLFNFYSKKFPYLKKHIAMREDQGKDILQLLDSNKVFFDITKDEILKGKEILRKNVKTDYKGIVLLCVRNEGYNKSFFKDHNWDHYNYRNYSFEDFIPAANYLADMNYLVLRMGKYNSNEIGTKNKNIIDYSNENWRSDFMDYFLGYECDICITTHTGMDCFARLFRKHFGAIVNPIGDLYFFQKNYTQIFGDLEFIQNKKKLSLDEIYSNNFHLIDVFRKEINNKFKLIKNNSDQILDLVKEVVLNFENNNNLKNSLNDLFWEKFDINYLNQDLEDIREAAQILKELKNSNQIYNKIQGKICYRFLEKSQHLFK